MLGAEIVPSSSVFNADSEYWLEKINVGVISRDL